MYKARKQALINIPDQIKELEEKMASIRSQSADSVSVKGGGGTKEDAYLNNIVTRELLSANLEESRRAVSRVSGALSILTDDEKEALKRFYIDKERNAAFNLAEKWNVERKTVYPRKDAALEKFAIAMYGNK